jgi:hypothetical protein
MFKLNTQKLVAAGLNPADVVILEDGQTLAQRCADRRSARSQINEKRAQINNSKFLSTEQKIEFLAQNSFSSMLATKPAANDNGIAGKAYATMTQIINSNPHLVGLAYNPESGITFSKNADDFYLNTEWNGKQDVKNGKVIYKNWLIDNAMQRKEWFDKAIIESDYRLAGITAGPVKSLDGKTDTFAKEVKGPVFGESDVAVAMYYLQNIKTGEVKRLIGEETVWLSLGGWSSRSDCAPRCLDDAAYGLDGGRVLGGRARALAESRVKSLTQKTK